MAFAQVTATAHFDLPSQSLADSLRAIGSETKTDVLFNPKLVAGLRAPALKADLTAQEAIRRLLKGTGLSYELLNGATVIVTDRKAPAPSNSEKLPSRTTGDGRPSRQDAASQSRAEAPTGNQTEVSTRKQTEAPAQNRPEVAMLQEVVVTAQKRQERVHDVPMGVTAITGDELQSQRLLDLADFVTKVPGLSVENSIPGFDRLTIRGESVDGNGSTVATYLDDVPFGSSTSFANGQFLAGNFDTWDLQRVEVLRGPQGTLYGASSEGGLFKYVTNAPQLNRFSSAFELGAENVAHGRTGPSYKAMLNLPVGGIAALRLDGYYSRTPGYVYNLRLGENDVNRAHREGGRASILLQPNDDFSIRLTAFTQTLHSDGVPAVDVVGADNTPLTPPANQFQTVDGTYGQRTFLDQPMTTKYDIFSGTIDWNLGWGTLTSVTGYQKIDQNLSIDATSSPYDYGFAPYDYGQLVGILGPLLNPTIPPGTQFAVLDTTEANIRKYTQEMRLASSTGGPLEWQVGGFFAHESSALPQNLPSLILPTLAPSGLPPVVTAATNALYREWAAFGQVTYHFSPAFDVALGGRWSENKQSVKTADSGLLLLLGGIPSETATGASTGTDFLYSVAPRWHVSQNTMAYARVATGYRPGGPNAPPPTAPAGFQLIYKSDSTINYEAGIKSSQLDNRLSVDVAAFLIKWRDVQLSQAIDGFDFTGNGGSATSKGLEWSLGLTPVDGLNLTLTGAYVHAYLTANAPAAGGFDGDELPYVPKISNSLDAAYTWKAFADYNAFAGATWSYIGSRVIDFDVITVPVTDMPLALPRPALGGYNTINLRAGLDNGHWSFELYCKNLADSRGLTAYGGDSAPNFGGTIEYQQPRTVGATLDLRF
jgi:outer membrane receptor protein involved in Fe transport